MFHRVCFVGAALLVFACAAPSQQALPDQPIQPGTLAANENSSVMQPESKRIFGIVPNYRTSASLSNLEPLTPGEKFKIATEDAFDRGSFALAALFAGEGQLTNANRSFGQGAAGFGRYYGTAFADFATGNYMTEAIYPTLFRQDHAIFDAVLELDGRGSGTPWVRFCGHMEIQDALRSISPS